MKSPDYYKNREQTYVKHFFLERYLETLAFHIGYFRREFVYVDCFAGPWRANDEELGDTSIRIALDRLNYVREALAQQGKRPSIRAIFIEKDPDSFATLQRALDQYRAAIETSAYQGTFEDNIGNILRDIGKAFAFFFIDPKGWTGFAMDNIRPVLQHEPGEVMVNFMYDFVNRFLNYADPENESSLDHFFGTAQWRDIRNQKNREAESIRLYTEQLRNVGGYDYATSTRILKPLQNRAYFHLAYATRNAKGIIEFREVERRAFKEQEAARQAAQREHREERTKQTEIIFTAAGTEGWTGRDEERRAQLAKATTTVNAILRNEAISYGRLQPRVLQLPLVWDDDLQSILIDANKQGTVTIEGLRPRQRKLRADNIIRLAQGSS